MARCVVERKFTTNSSYIVGDFVNTDSVSDYTSCAFVVETGPEYAARLARDAQVGSGSSGSGGGGACTNPFSMSAEDGGLLSAAIVGCWAAAYFIRSVINVVRNGVES